MRTTYINSGGHEREQVITETWDLLRQRIDDGATLTIEDIEPAISRICPRWEDSAESVIAALTARAYQAIIDEVNQLAGQPAAATVVDLRPLLAAHHYREELDKFSAAIVAA